jgi:hypothetical protein
VTDAVQHCSGNPRGDTNREENVMRTKHLLTALTVAAGLVLPAGAAQAESRNLQRARAETARYRDLNRAIEAGYGLLTDAAGIACIDNPGVGGMGIHYANGALVGEPTVNATKPEVLVYAPTRDGRLRLVALEYVVLQSAWEQAGHSAAPRLFDQEFELVPAGNRYGLPPFYELHAWVWKHNARGTFDDWNPDVHCP